MKDTIQQIVEMDRRAREITEAAQTERTHSEKEITERYDELRRSYLEKAKHRIEVNELRSAPLQKPTGKKREAHLTALKRRDGTAVQCQRRTVGRSNCRTGAGYRLRAMKLSDFSSNAVLSKARAMYGRHLTREDYTNLLACRTVSEVAYYLKNNTSYAETLTEINESEVHRGRLEQFLRRRAFPDVAKLCIYDSTSGAHFSNYLVRYAEVTQLMHVVMYLASGSSDAYLFRIPTLFSHLVRLDLSRLAQVSSLCRPPGGGRTHPILCAASALPPFDGRIYRLYRDRNGVVYQPVCCRLRYDPANAWQGRIRGNQKAVRLLY